MKITLTSQIEQAGQQETIVKTAFGTSEQVGAAIRFKAIEAPQSQLNILLKPQTLLVSRRQDDANHALWRFKFGQAQKCVYVANGFQMTLTSRTSVLKQTVLSAQTTKVKVEYRLFSGLYLVGNYRVSLIFTDLPSMMGKD